MTSPPRPVLLLLAAALTLAVAIGWLVAEYLGGFGVPNVPRIGIGLLMVPATLALTVVAAGGVGRLRERNQSQAELHAVAGGEPARAGTMELFERMHELDRSSLVRVLGIGRVVERDGITVEFLALELRGGGGAITLRAHGPGIATAGGMVRWPRMTVTDDLDTKYLFSPGGGGVDEHSMQYELRFVPAPRSGVRMLDVAVVEFSSTAWPFDRTERTDAVPEAAPWRVAVDLQ